MIDHMLAHLHWGRSWDLDHLPPPGYADSSQPTGALRTRPDAVFDDPRRRFPTPPAVVRGVALLARLLLTRWCLFHGRFDERWWRCLLLFHLLDTLVGSRQWFLQDVDLLQRLAQLLFKLLDPFFCCHCRSISDEGQSEQFRKKHVKTFVTRA